MLTMRFSALVVAVCVAFAARGGGRLPAEASSAPHIAEPVVATFVAGTLTLDGDHLAGTAESLRFQYDGVSMTISAPSPLITLWSDNRIDLSLPPVVHSGSVSVIAGGNESAAVPLLVYEYSAFPMGAINGRLSYPSALDIDSGGRVWVNEEAHIELKSITPSDPPTTNVFPIPQMSPPGIFAGPDRRTTASTHAEDIAVESDGTIWFGEGGAYLYAGANFNSSRIIHYQPATGHFDCYNVPDDDAEVAGLLVDRARGVVWYAESSIVHGNAIGGLPLATAVSDCAWTPDAGPRTPRCDLQQAPGCHTSYQLPQPHSSPMQLAFDSSGKIWFTEYWGTRVGRLDPDTGALVELPLPTPIVRQGPGLYAGAGPFDLAFDGAGDLWIAEEFDATILRLRSSLMSSKDCTTLDAAGTNPCVTKVFVGTDGSDGTTGHGVIAGSDGLVWFTLTGSAAGTSRVGFIDTAHGDVPVLLPMLAGIRSLSGVTQDPANGTIWFGEYSDRAIGRMRLAAGDADGVPDAVDNCPGVYNPGQENHDRNFIDLSPYGKAFNDLSRPNADALGDACDPDADNDRLLNLDESDVAPGGAAHALCASASASTDPTKADTDGDLVLDGAECALGTDPADRSSTPARSPAGDSDHDGLMDAFEATIGSDPAKWDTDGDGVSDGVEYKSYGTNPLLRNSDGDLCGDAKKVASIDANPAVTATDLLQVARAYGSSSGSRYVPDFDPNKDGAINATDLQFIAVRFGGCA